MVKCKNCSETHISDIQLGSTKKEFFNMARNSTLIDNSEYCSFCGQVSVYSDRDYFWED